MPACAQLASVTARLTCPHPAAGEAEPYGSSVAGVVYMQHVSRGTCSTLPESLGVYADEADVISLASAAWD